MILQLMLNTLKLLKTYCSATHAVALFGRVNDFQLKNAADGYVTRAKLLTFLEMA